MFRNIKAYVAIFCMLCHIKLPSQRTTFMIKGPPLSYVHIFMQRRGGGGEGVEERGWRSGGGGERVDPYDLTGKKQTFF